MGVLNKTRKVSRCSPPSRVLKSKVDGAVRGKPGLAGIGGVLRNYKGEVMYMFSKYAGSKTLTKTKHSVSITPLSP